MHQLFFRTLFFSLLFLLVTGCVVQVRPIPMLEFHPLSIELDD
jgi:hypothetical protein